MSDAENKSGEEHIEDGPAAFTKFPPLVFLQKLAPAERQMVCADDYYEAAKVLVDGCADGSLHDGTMASPALYLVRHYLELQFKSLILCARRLRDWETNAGEIKEAEHGHPLEEFWSRAKQEAMKRMPSKEWDPFDIAFVDDLVSHFDACDPKGQCFRYNSMIVKTEKVKCPGFHVDFGLLRQGLRHVHDVLDGIQGYFMEQHHENDEWRSIQDS